MSYSPMQAIDERSTEVHEAIRTEDVEALYHLARLFKEEGEDEIAEDLVKKAKQIEKDEMAYDANNNN